MSRRLQQIGSGGSSNSRDQHGEEAASDMTVLDNASPRKDLSLVTDFQDAAEVDGETKSM
ncbi:hypothetical protein FRB97_000953, partial [Tulasnella sp. 331]